MTDMQQLYSACGKLLKDPDVDLTPLLPIYERICQFILSGCFLLHFGLFKDIVYNVIITDANATGFCGILFKLCRTDAADSRIEMVEYCKEIVEQLKLPKSHSYNLFPVRVIGSAFNTAIQKQSSTYRERLSQLLAIDEFYSYLDAPTVLVTDNQNCQKFWHTIDEYVQHVGEIIGGSLFTAWTRFCATVTQIIWIQRGSECVTLCDELARTIARESSTAAATSSLAMNALLVQHDALNPNDGLNDDDNNDVRTGNDDDNIDDDSQVANPDNYPTTNSTATTDEFTTVSTTPTNYPLPLRDAIIDAYVNDTSTYLGISMFRIYNAVVHGIKYDQRTQNLSARFFLHNDLLYHARQFGPAQVYVPTGGNIALHSTHTGSIRANILYHFHDSNLGFHRGYHKMLKSISEHFWWPSMLADTLNYCKSCNKCQLEKLKFSKYKGSIRSFTDVMPFSSWVVDYAGPMDGEYIFVAICVFSSYAIFCKADDCTAATTAQIILERIICQFGIPLNIYSDRGSAFTSDIITEISQKLGIRWRASCSYSPRTQGLAERLIQDIKNTCSSMDWDLTHLPLIQLYHINSLIGNSPLTPFEVIHGIKPNISPLVPPTTLDSNISEGMVTINRYWFNTHQQWLKWDAEFTTVPLSDIKLVGLKLTRDFRIPQKILRTFLH